MQERVGQQQECHAKEKIQDGPCEITSRIVHVLILLRIRLARRWRAFLYFKIPRIYKILVLTSSLLPVGRYAIVYAKNHDLGLLKKSPTCVQTPSPEPYHSAI